MSTFMNGIEILTALSTTVIAVLGGSISVHRYIFDFKPKVKVVLKRVSPKASLALNLPKAIYLMIQVTNERATVHLSGLYSQIPKEEDGMIHLFIHKEEGKKINFGYTLENGKHCNPFVPINEDQIKKIQNAKRLVIIDSTEKIIYKCSGKKLKELKESFK